MAQKLRVWKDGRWPQEFFGVDLFNKLNEGDYQTACEFFREHPKYIDYYYYGWSLLHHFAKRDYPQLLATLVELGMDVNVEGEQYPWGPLCDAVDTGKIHSARWLLEHGAKTTCEYRGLTFSCGALSAVAAGEFEMVKLLVEYGAPVDILADDPPRGLLTEAINGGHTEIADYLRSKGALTDEEIKRRAKGTTNPRKGKK